MMTMNLSLSTMVMMEITFIANNDDILVIAETKCRNFKLHCILLKIKASSAAGDCTSRPLHLGSTTGGNPYQNS